MRAFFALKIWRLRINMTIYLRIMMVTCLIACTANVFAEEAARPPESITSIENALVNYLNGASDAAELDATSCDAQNKQIGVFIETHARDLHALHQLAERAREGGLDQSTVEAILDGLDGAVGEAKNRFTGSIRGFCQTNKVRILSRLYIELKPSEEATAMRLGLDEAEQRIAEKKAARAETPELVVSTPDKPGPMGLFGPISFGMTMAEAFEAQPALIKRGCGGGGRTGSGIDDEHTVDDIRYPFNDKHFAAEGAFPWSWPDHGDFYVGDAINVSACILFVGVVRADEENGGESAWQVDSIKVDFFSYKVLFDLVLTDLTKRWGEPFKREVDNKGQIDRFHLWRDADAGHCVIMKDGYFGGSKESYYLNIQPCWGIDHFIGFMITPAGEPGAILGMTLKELQVRFGEGSISRTRDLNSFYPV